MKQRVRQCVGALVTGVVLAGGVVGCGSADTSAGTAEPASSTGGSDYYPHTVPTLHGDVTIEEAPERIVAMSGTTADELLSLGVAPVAVAEDPDSLEQNYPWLVEEIAETAVSGLRSGWEPQAEAIAALEPDLIIASTLMLEDEQTFHRLNEIAPTIAPDSDSNNVDWETRLRYTAEAVDAVEEAESLMTEVEAEYGEASDGLGGVSASTYNWAYFDGEQFGFGNGSLLELFGLQPAPSQDNTNAQMLAQENTAALDADLLVVYPLTEENRDQLDNDELFQSLPAVVNGTVYYVSAGEANALNTPAPLALDWFRERIGPSVRALAEGS